MPSSPSWEPWEERVVRKYCRTMHSTWCARVLGRSKSAVNQKARSMGVTGGVYRSHSRLTADQVRAIREAKGEKTLRELSAEYGVHYNTIWQVQAYANYYHVL